MANLYITNVYIHNKGDLDIKTVVQLLNEAIESHRDPVKRVLNRQFKNTSGNLLSTT